MNAPFDDFPLRHRRALEIIFPLIVAYVILRTQLVDVERTIKWTLRKSTIVGV